MGPPCSKICELASSGLRTWISSSSKRVELSLLLSLALEDLTAIGFMRSLRVRNSSFSNSGASADSSTPFHAKLSMLTSKGTSCIN